MFSRIELSGSSMIFSERHSAILRISAVRCVPHAVLRIERRSTWRENPRSLQNPPNRPAVQILSKSSVKSSAARREKNPAWERRGAGTLDELEPIAREHPVRIISLVTGAKEGWDALANGYPISVCFDQRFTI